MSILTRRRGHCIVCVAIAMLLLGDAVADVPVAADIPLWFSCSGPADDETRAACANYERAILDATVQVRILSYCTGRPEAAIWWFDSHATILDDHTLLTHNHFRILSDERCALDVVILYAPGGERIGAISDSMELADIARQLTGSCFAQSCELALKRPYLTPPRDVRIVHPDHAVLASQIGLLPEVAEINWRGERGTTFVQWVHPVRVSTRGDVPVIELMCGVMDGASGGGVWAVTSDGLLYIGNIWLTREDGTGSVAALNLPGAVQ